MACHFIHRKLTENTAECQGQPKSIYTTLCADAYHLPLEQLLSTDGEGAPKVESKLSTGGKNGKTWPLGGVVLS